MKADAVQRENEVIFVCGISNRKRRMCPVLWLGTLRMRFGLEWKKRLNRMQSEAN